MVRESLFQMEWYLSILVTECLAECLEMHYLHFQLIRNKHEQSNKLISSMDDKPMTRCYFCGMKRSIFR